MVLSLLLHWVITAAILLLIGNVMPGIHLASFGTAMIAAVIMGLVNFFIKPILSILTLPLNFLTLGLFSFVINALMFALVAWMVPGFEVSNFMSALGGSILMAIMTSLLGMLLPERTSRAL
jgi:putative membrane protein